MGYGSNINALNGDLRQIEQMLRSGSIYNSRNGLTERMKKFESVKLITNKAENEILKQVRSLL